MSRQNEKVPLRESNNYTQGKGTDTATKKLRGPVKSVTHNPTSGGGIHRATKGK